MSFFTEALVGILTSREGVMRSPVREVGKPRTGQSILCPMTAIGAVWTTPKTGMSLLKHGSRKRCQVSMILSHKKTSDCSGVFLVFGIVVNKYMTVSYYLSRAFYGRVCALVTHPMKLSLLVLALGAVITYLSTAFMPEPPKAMTTAVGVIMFVIGVVLVIASLGGLDLHF